MEREGMADGRPRRWRPSVSTGCLGAGVVLTVLSYLWPAGGGGREAVVTLLGLCLLGVWAGAWIDRRRLQQEMRQQALYDPLTSSPTARCSSTVWTMPSPAPSVGA